MTVFLRKVFACIFSALALLLAPIAIITAVSSSAVEDTIQNSREISKSFLLASDFVEQFRIDHGHLPNENEFSEWAETQPDKVDSAKQMQIVTSRLQFPPEVVEKFGTPPINGYIVEYWRGEWFEYFASWVSTSTLEFEEKKFYLLGSAFADGLAILAFSTIFGVISIYLWPRTNQ